MTNARHRVLFVNHAVPELFKIGRILARAFEVRGATDLDEAWSLLMSSHFDVLLLDATLSGSRGDELFHIARLMFPDVARVVLTSGEGLDRRELADAVIDRGASPEVLVESVRSSCPLSPLVPRVKLKLDPKSVA